MKFDSITYTLTDVIKFLGFVTIMSSMWYDLKTDFAVHKAEHLLIEHRIGNLEKQLAVNTYEAIMPKELQLKDDKQTHHNR